MPSDRAYVVSFKEFMKSSPTIEMLRQWEEERYGESDRACGILFGSYLESALDAALKSAFRPDLSGTVAEDLFDHKGAIGLFSAKINIAYAIAIFGNKTRHDLNLIRMMRNGFAHRELPIKFDMPAVKKVCDHLQIPDTHVSVPPWIFMSLERTDKMKSRGQWDDMKNPKTRFVTSCHCIAFNLLDFANRKTRRPLDRSSLP
jgi:hypothetical protein